MTTLAVRLNPFKYSVFNIDRFERSFLLLKFLIFDGLPHTVRARNPNRLNSRRKFIRLYDRIEKAVKRFLVENNSTPVRKISVKTFRKTVRRRTAHFSSSFLLVYGKTIRKSNFFHEKVNTNPAFIVRSTRTVQKSIPKALTKMSGTSIYFHFFFFR